MMISRSALCISAVLVVFNFCGLDFQSLGRHQWRCNNRSNYRQGQQSEDILNSNHGESSLSKLTTTEVNEACNTDHVNVAVESSVKD